MSETTAVVRVGSTLAKVAREPSAHFLLLGAVLFVVYHFVASDRTPRTEIHVSSGDIARLRTEFAKYNGRAPHDDEERQLVDKWINDEIFYREALHLQLWKDDIVVKHRLVQQMEFLSEDLGSFSDPSEAELSAWVGAHPDVYRVPARVAIQQVYLSRDRRGAQLVADAEVVRAELVKGGDPDHLGDPFILGNHIPLKSRDELEGSFGGELAQRAFEAKPGAFVGPFTSSYGLHFLRVEDRHDAELPRLAEVRARARQDVIDARRAEASTATLDRLRGSYSIVVDPAPPHEEAQAVPVAEDD
jgi:hypothetical protein